LALEGEGVVVNAMPQPLHPRERDHVPTVQEAGWALGPVWVSAEYLAPTRVQTLDHPAHSVTAYTNYAILAAE